MACADREEDLNLYLDGELPEARRRPIEEHLRACDACRAELQAMRRLHDLIQRAPPVGSEGSGPFRGLEGAIARARAGAVLRARLRVAAALAACVLALAIGYALAPRAPATLDERVVRLLADYARAETDAARDAVVRDLEEGGERVLPYLVHALDSPTLSVQVAAVQILGRYRHPKVGQALTEYAVRRGMLGPPARPAEDLLDEPLSVDAAVGLLDADGVPREFALDALRSVYNRFRLDPREVEILRRIGYTRPATFSPQAQAVVTALRDRLRSGELKRQLAAIEAARALRAAALVPDLIACLGTEGAREAAHVALREVTRQELPLDASAWERWDRAARKADASLVAPAATK